MAKEYFQDILPPSDDSEPYAHASPQTSESNIESSAPPPETRSIRNISVPSRPRTLERRDPPPPYGNMPHASRVAWGGNMLWVAAAAAIILLIGLALFVFRPTTVTVVPRSHTVTFDASSSFVAYPSTSTSSALTYRVQSFDVEDSQVVATHGTQHAEHKATGTITVFNSYSKDPVKLVKTTRFATPDGLIFRSLSDIAIPGMKGTKPGSVDISVIADQVGQTYNIGPVAKFTLPGLKGGVMFSKVYALSNAAMSGGFSGDEPATAPGEMDAAVAQVRSRLQAAIATKVAQASSSSVAFPELASISYLDLPNTTEGTASVRVHEKAHVELPVFDSSAFALAVASMVSADAESGSVRLVPSTGYGVKPAATSVALGQDPLSFSLTGTAMLVWNVDTQALANSLAGKDQSAFQTVVNTFAGIQEARARIEPFWKSSFPSNASSIRIIMSNPAPQP